MSQTYVKANNQAATAVEYRALRGTDERRGFRNTTARQRGHRRHATRLVQLAYLPGSRDI